MQARPYSPLEFLQKRGLPIAVDIDSSGVKQATSLNCSINITGCSSRSRIHSASDTDFVSIVVYFGVGILFWRLGLGFVYAQSILILCYLEGKSFLLDYSITDD